MSQVQRALLDLPDTPEQADASTVQLATERELSIEKTRHDRRAHRRYRDQELRWVRHARLNGGHAVAIVDLSAGGALVDSRFPLRPDAFLTLEIEGPGFDRSIPFRVVRCQVGALNRGQMIYRGGCEFTSSIELPPKIRSRARILYPNQFAGLDAVAPIDPPRVASAEPGDAPHARAWQKIVVRYTEGQLLKGYTLDFNPARTQFSLWPSPISKPQDRVIVPLGRLKGVFFVRDFDGNPSYVERRDAEQRQHGRRIEVTLLDNEVIVGWTLNYRPDGHGFFVIPADPLANNIRVFIVSTAVRHVRFP